MQNYSLYAIVDVKAKCIVNTFTSVNNSTAERQFIDLLSDPRDNIFNLHPADFTLYHVCDLSFDKGTISVSEPSISDTLIANGFTGKVIKTDEVVFEGSSLSKERLESLRISRKEFLVKFRNEVNHFVTPQERVPECAVPIDDKTVEKLFNKGKEVRRKIK